VIDRVKAQKLILSNFQSPGDVVMLTAAVRDLHACYPGRFLTDVRTPWPELWRNNPYLTKLDDRDPTVGRIECQYPLVQFSNQRPVHFLYGFIEHLNQQLGLRIVPTQFKGDVHLSDAEKAAASPIQMLTGGDVPYWIIVAGGKYDYTIKWWHFRRWQAVVDQLRDRVPFVQVGERTHYHPRLNGVLDLRGKTNLRDLIRLVYHADGVLCPVTLIMHLAAAIETRPGAAQARACVVVAGGREPSHWEAYPTHQFVHTVGLLPCCAKGGCWRSRSVPLGDGDEKDEPQHLCRDLVDNLPRCMHLITPEMVIGRIELCLAAAPDRATVAYDLAHLAPHLSQRASPPLTVAKAPAAALIPFSRKPTINSHKSLCPRTTS
jgi:ADP-heptose:LPS heptosyltransferase